MNLEDKLLYLSVRIESFQEGNENKNILGSGIWWQPNPNSQYVYVFTAAHIFSEENISISYIDKDQKYRCVRVDRGDIAIHKELFLEDGKLPMNDVAVIRCKREKIMNIELCSYKFLKPENTIDNKEIIFRGFPDVLNDKSFVMSNKKIDAIRENIDRVSKRFTYSLSTGLNNVERDEEMIGISGAGIFLNSTDEILFLGIHTNGVGVNAGLGTFSGMSCELIYDICKDMRWDEPKFVCDICGNLKDCAKNFLDEINNDELVEIMYKLIDENFDYVFKCDFCGNSKECESNITPHECTIFRNSLLIVLCILKYLNKSVDFEKPIINLKSKLIPVKYICSDGDLDLSRFSIESFIRSLKTDYLMRNKVEDNTLIIWNTKKQIRGEQVCSSQKFKKIISDIKGEFLYGTGFDILKGFSQPKELSIININELLNSIEDESLINMVKAIENII